MANPLCEDVNPFCEYTGEYIKAIKNSTLILLPWITTKILLKNIQYWRYNISCHLDLTSKDNSIF